MTDILKEVIGDACQESGITLNAQEMETAAQELRRRIILDRYDGKSWGAGAMMAAAILTAIAPDRVTKQESLHIP